MTENPLIANNEKSGRDWSFGNKVLGIVVTANVSLLVFEQWRSFDGIQKFIALELLAFLVVIPALAIWREKSKGVRTERPTLIAFGYMCLLFLVILFRHHS